MSRCQTFVAATSLEPSPLIGEKDGDYGGEDVCDGVHDDGGRAHICQKYHKLYLWTKNCHVAKFWEILEKFGEIWGNLGRFCHNLRAFMWRKN